MRRKGSRNSGGKKISNQPIIFNIQYTPYRLPKTATDEERERHTDERAFFDLTGDKNVFDYITTEGKRTGKRTALEYLQKNTGVFNDKGMIPQEQVDEMKARLKENEGNIWHGFISLNAVESPKIDTPEKCIELIKRTFPSFLKDAKFRPDNVDLMCALHLDRPHHLHIHFIFWEKEPIYKNAQTGKTGYRRRGRIDKKSIDGMLVRLGLFLSDKKEILYKTRDEAISDLRELLGAKAFVCKPDDVKKEILALARDLPKEGRITYGSKDMEPYRARVDNIVQMLLATDARARRANRRFYRALAGREREVHNICGKPYAYSDKNIRPETMEKNLPKYHNKIDEKNIQVIEEIRADYKRRQGNLVLELAKFIKPEYYENKRKRKANDNKLKRSLGISRRNTGRAIKKFLSSFGQECEYIERDFYHRLQEIEEEMEQERKKQDAASSGNGEIK